MVEFSFSSRFTPDVAGESILRVIRQSWSGNRRVGVTGFLRVDGDCVEQTIEGPSTVVLALAARILTDRRHCEIQIHRFGPVALRSFADWSVAGLDAAPAVRLPDGPRAKLRLLTSVPAAPSREDSPKFAVARAT